MFRLHIVLEAKELRGLRALDERHRLGLPEKTELRKCPHSHSYFPKCEISEATARRLGGFEDADVRVITVRTWDWLVAGDVEPCPACAERGKDGVRLSLTRERIIQLAERASYEERINNLVADLNRMQYELKERTREVEKLREKLAEREAELEALKKG